MGKNSQNKTLLCVGIMLPDQVIDKLHEAEISCVFVEIDFLINNPLQTQKQIILISQSYITNYLNSRSDINKLKKIFIYPVLIFTSDHEETFRIIKQFGPTYYDFVVESIIPELKTDKILNFVKTTNRILELVDLQTKLMSIESDKERDEVKIEKLIQELELKALSSELTEQRLRKEIELKNIYEKEVSKLNQSLQEQTIRLNDLNRELKSYTYTVSHDLKAPLRGIIGYSQELLTRHSNNLSERALFCIKQISTAAKNLEALIEDLLSYSRIELEIPTAIEINVKELLSECINEMNKIISDYQTQIEINVECENIWGWKRGLKQALCNLLNNAIKYSSKSENPTVSVSCKKIDKKFFIEVKDNGIGFDMEYSDRIFNLFQRLVKNEEFEGTGAGLAIVKKVIEKMGGKVSAISSPGMGATFILELPANI